tara:strand:- start:102 stop:401 length:300 start_codon:yes stop_codon:yes gene_type:complete
MKDLPSKKLTNKQKLDFLTKLKNINENGHEILYVLIRIFAKLKKKDTSITPFKSNSNDEKTEFTFDLNNFPNKLGQLLYKFIILHHNTTQNDLNIHKKI